MNERLVTLAKDFLRGYLTPGEWFTPSQLEDDILGGPDVSKLFMGRSRAQDTPFGHALNQLIENGEVMAENTDDGWRYRRS